MGLDEREHVGVVIAAGSLLMTVKNTFKSKATASQLFSPEPRAGEGEVIIEDRMTEGDGLQMRTAERAHEDGGPGHERGLL